MANALSTNIKVFPTTQREKYDPTAKFTTEYNLTSLVNRLLDTKAFVINRNDKSWVDENILKNFNFNINGYYFSVNGLNLNDVGTKEGESKKYLNAYIKINTMDNVEEDAFSEVWSQLYGTDTDDGTKKELSDASKFEGISFQWEEKSSFDPNYFGASGKEGKEHFENVWRYKSAEKIDNAYTAYEYIFTILDSEYNIPLESSLKFKTDTVGNRSISIDDGVI